MGIICPLVGIGLTETPNSGWAKAHLAHPLAASLVYICMSVLDKPDSAFWEDFLYYLNNLFLSFLSKDIPLEKEFDPPTNKLIEPENVWSRFWLSFIQTTHLGILLPVVSKGFVSYFNHLIDIACIFWVKYLVKKMIIKSMFWLWRRI